MALFKRRSLFLIPVLVLACAVLGGLYGPTPSAAAASGDDDLSSYVNQFTHLYSTVEQNFADPVSPDKAIYNGAIPGMLRTLDPHSNFFDPKALAAMREDQRGHYYGVGMQVLGRTIGDRIVTVVVHPFPGSPSYKAGLLPNDVIANVNGKDTIGLTSDKVADLLKGPRGTPVTIQVERGDDAQKLTFNLVRDDIAHSSITAAFMVKPGIALVKIGSLGFIETTGSDFTNALAKLDEDHLKGLILDLRGNPGGLLTEAVTVAGHELPKGSEVVSHHGRASQERSYKATEGNHGRSYPIVVLVNRNSASASEIVTGAMQDHDRAWILGENTFGKGLVQTVYPLEEKTGLALTTAKYYTPSGRLIQRDYSNVSFFDYYDRRDTTARNPADVKMTDSGRTVYGGGGISPDEKFVEPKVGTMEAALLHGLELDDYTKHFFTVHKEKLAANWSVDDATMEDFHKWLLTQKFELNEAEYKKDLPQIRRDLQEDIYKTAFGLDRQTEYDLASDPEVAAAIDAMPKAQALLDNATRVRNERAQR